MLMRGSGRVTVGIGAVLLAGAACTSGTGSARRTSAGPPVRRSPVVTSTVPSASPSADATATPSGPAASSAVPRFPVTRAQAAVAYAQRHGMDSAVAVVDTHTGALTTAGRADRLFPTASVIKTMIATQVLLNGQMHGHAEDLAYTMITRSDNDDAYALYPQVGTDALLPNIAKHYGIDGLGEKPAFPGFWGSTRFTARGMVRFYAAVRADPAVWPWLHNAMRDHQPTTTAGEPNDFGLADLPHTAVKNGWNEGRDKIRPGDCQINSTGFVERGRYAVVILSEGPSSLYFTAGEQVVTKQAHLLFPAA